MPENEKDFVDSQKFVEFGNQVNETDSIEVTKNLNCVPNLVKRFGPGKAYHLRIGVGNEISLH